MQRPTYAWLGHDVSAPLMQANRSRKRRGAAPGEGALTRVWCAAGTQTVLSGNSVVDDSYAEERRRAADKAQRGWHELLLAFLEQSIEDYRVALERAQRTGKWSRKGAEIRDWFHGDPVPVSRPKFTFKQVCLLLKISPSFVLELLPTATPKASRRRFARGARAGWALDRQWPRRQAED
ncbi:hypothetical protein K2Z84_21530 [Candidatus Binatia bacterium]|nr:hypothetical protein [Candidatus Binatia bacterium]